VDTVGLQRKRATEEYLEKRSAERNVDCGFSRRKMETATQDRPG